MDATYEMKMKKESNLYPPKSPPPPPVGNMRVESGNKLGGEICDVLGLKHCTMLNINLRRNRLATVIAKLNIETNDAARIATILKKYRLEEIPEEQKEVA